MVDKFLVVIVIIFATMIGMYLLLSPVFLNTLVTISQDSNSSKNLSNDTRNETRDQTSILIDIVKKQEDDRQLDNKTYHKVLSKLNLALENQQKQINQSEISREKNNIRNNIILEKLENQSIQKQILLNNQKIQINLLIKSYNEIEKQTKQNNKILSQINNATSQINESVNLLTNLTQKDSKGAEVHRNITIDLYKITEYLKNITKDTHVQVKDLGGENNLMLKQIIPKLDNMTRILSEINIKLQ
jgi:hypothetical protein